MTEVTIIQVKGRDSLYRKYPRQNEAQPAYIELDCRDGELRADWNAEIGNAIPFTVYHGHVQRWGIPTLKADAANQLLVELKPLAQRVVDGYSSTWDGNNNVAAFTADAQAAIEEIGEATEAMKDEYDAMVQTGDAGVYLEEIRHPERLGLHGLESVEYEGFGTITADTTDEEITAMAKAMEASAYSDGYHLDGTEEALEEDREQCQEAKRRNEEDGDE